VKLASMAFAAAMATLAAVPAFGSTDFAGPYCDSGCRRIDSISGSGDQIYAGSVVKTYRVCHADPFALSVVVDGVKWNIPDGSPEHRNCLDVTGTSIGVYGNAAWVGPVGP
jgi:hypothetical protein